MMFSNSIKEVLLCLIRLGTGKETKPNVILPKDKIDWEALKALANEQGLLAVVLDGLDRLNADGVVVDMPKKVRLEWIGEVLQGYEYRYELYRRAIAEMAGFYNSQGFKMMVLKGMPVHWIGLSRNIVLAGILISGSLGSKKQLTLCLLLVPSFRIQVSRLTTAIIITRCSIGGISWWRITMTL